MTIPIKIIKKEDYLEKNNKPDQEKIWDSIAKPWKTYVVKKIPIVEEFLKSKKGKVIDFGCGTGRNMIPNKNIQYYGIDFSKEQLKQAKKYITKNRINAKLHLSKLDELNKKIFKDKMFNHGLFISSLHCMESKEERLNSLKEFHRILKPKSQALISVWNSEDKRFISVNNHGPVYMSWKELGVPHMRFYYLYKKKEFLDLIKSIGFKILEFYKPTKKDRFSKKNWIIRVRK